MLFLNTFLIILYLKILPIKSFEFDSNLLKRASNGKGLTTIITEGRFFSPGTHAQDKYSTINVFL